MSAHLRMIVSRKSSNTNLNVLLDKLQKSSFITFNYNKEIYWKDNQCEIIEVTIDCEVPLSESTWIGFLDGFSDNVSVSKDETYMEIALFSEISNENDVFITMYVPLEMIDIRNNL